MKLIPLSLSQRKLYSFPSIYHFTKCYYSYILRMGDKTFHATYTFCFSGLDILFIGSDFQPVRLIISSDVWVSIQPELSLNMKTICYTSSLHNTMIFSNICDHVCAISTSPYICIICNDSTSYLNFTPWLDLSLFLYCR